MNLRLEMGKRVRLGIRLVIGMGWGGDGDGNECMVYGINIHNSETKEN